MNTQTLAALEEAIEPYRREGFVITSQSEGAITLIYPTDRFSYLFFIITLLLIWPVAVIYLISHNRQQVRSVCLRITSQGYIEESGYTLSLLKRDRKHRRLLTLLFAGGVVSILVLIFLVLGYRYR